MGVIHVGLRQWDVTHKVLQRSNLLSISTLCIFHTTLLQAKAKATHPMVKSKNKLTHLSQLLYFTCKGGGTHEKHEAAILVPTIERVAKKAAQLLFTAL